jgi:hypothetical protein
MGPQGSQGATGQIIYLEPDYIEGDQGIPGTMGATGQQGPQGPLSQDGYDGEDGQTIVGPQGLQGLQGVQGLSGAQADDLIELLKYAFARIKFLEQAVGVTWNSNEIYVPDQVSLLDERELDYSSIGG